MGWLDSVVYVSALTLWALVSGHWAAWAAARVEVKQDEQMGGSMRDVIVQYGIALMVLAAVLILVAGRRW